MFEPAIRQAVAALAAEGLQVLMPGHCTGWTDHIALAAGLPDAFRPNAVGSRYEL